MYFDTVYLLHEYTDGEMRTVMECIFIIFFYFQVDSDLGGHIVEVQDSRLMFGIEWAQTVRTGW